MASKPNYGNIRNEKKKNGGLEMEDKPNNIPTLSDYKKRKRKKPDIEIVEKVMDTETDLSNASQLRRERSRARRQINRALIEAPPTTETLKDREKVTNILSAETLEKKLGFDLSVIGKKDLKPNYSLAERKRRTRRNRNKTKPKKQQKFNSKRFKFGYYEDEQEQLDELLEITKQLTGGKKDARKRRDKTEKERIDSIVQDVVDREKDQFNGYYENVLPNDYDEVVNEKSNLMTIIMGVGLIAVSFILAFVIISMIFGQGSIFG